MIETLDKLLGAGIVTVPLLIHSCRFLRKSFNLFELHSLPKAEGLIMHSLRAHFLNSSILLNLFCSVTYENTFKSY